MVVGKVEFALSLVEGFVGIVGKYFDEGLDGRYVFHIFVFFIILLQFFLSECAFLLINFFSEWDKLLAFLFHFDVFAFDLEQFES